MTAAHLVRRWWGSVTASAPGAEHEVWAQKWLLPGERRVWRRLVDADRAHAITVARRFMALRPGASRPEMAAALLHDCGKLDSALGTWGRVAATLVGSRWAPWRPYHEHEQRGADLLEAAGSHPVTVALVGRRPCAPADALAALDTADQV